MPHPTQQTSSETINFRATRDQKALFDRAARRLGKTRTEFLLDCAQEAAENALLDQRLFLADEETFTSLLAKLDAPVEPNEALKALLQSPSPWD